MSLSDRSLSMLKPSTLLTLTLALASVISPVEAAVSCTSSSPQCCWVVRSWQLMGKFTSARSTSSTACCEIPGVDCTFRGIVESLDWSRERLRGSIPKEIGNLVNLERLYLEENQLSGSIPPEIGNLVNLERLYLYSNQFSGSIPAVIGNLVKLQRLYLHNNQLSGSIPAEIGNLVNLQYLYLHNNQLSGSIPPEIGNLSNLLVLYLYSNQLSGSIPPEIGNLVNLRWLDLHENQLSGSIPPEIGNLVNLRTLGLFSNQLSGSIPAEIGNLVNLKELYLEGNVGLNGTFTPQCSIRVYALNTNIIICGCSSSASPPSIFPPAGTPDACLASGPSMSLEKRILAFSDVIGSYKYTCNTDANANPFADCLNTMAKICNPNSPDFLVNRCKEGVDQMTGKMSALWQKVRKECGQWPWYGFTGNKDSSNCASANVALQNNAFYLNWNSETLEWEQKFVSIKLTESVKEVLWSNTALRG